MKFIASFHETAGSLRFGGTAIPVVAALVLGAGGQAQAAPLNLKLLDTLDSVPSLMDVNREGGVGKISWGELS